MEHNASEFIVRGTVERIRFRNDANHYTVGDLVPDAREQPDSLFSRSPGPSSRAVTFNGYFPEIDTGDHLELRGAWQQHPRYGLQLKVARYERVLPTSARGIATYLAASVSGVGEKTAARLVEAFGEDTLHVIEHEPERLIAIRGISRNKADAIREAVVSRQNTERVMLFLFEHGITPGLAARIYNHYGDDAIEIVRDNPYRLTDEVFGIGFVTADGIARATGLPFHDQTRLQAAARHVLSASAAGEGHTFLPRDELVTRVCELVNGSIEDDCEPVTADEVETAVLTLVEAGRLIKEDSAIYLPYLYQAETRLAARLRELAARRPAAPTDELERVIGAVEGELEVEYAEQQRAAIRSALSHGVSVITGGPGTGKTTVIRGLVMVADRLQSGTVKLLACPTGRAARRLSEATGLPASTIHRLLGWKRAGGGWAFEYNEKNRLPGDLLIIDETSMIDVILAWDLVQAIDDGTRVVFVGDADQLPSVGPGNVLRDIIESGTVPTVVLSTVFRQGERSDIVLTAHEIRHGRAPARDYWVPDGSVPGREFAFMPRPDPTAAAELTVELAIELTMAGKNVQVLAPMYRGVCGVDALNAALQSNLNPARPGVPEVKMGFRTFRLGDRVMQIRNNYDREVFNGDVGHIVGIERDEDGREISVDFEGHLVGYRELELDELVLAYAVTVHKSQGSEFEVVLLAMVRGHYIMLRRNLLYTAVSRAKQKMIVVGDPRALIAAVRNDEVVRRCFRLKDRLAGADQCQ